MNPKKSEQNINSNPSQGSNKPERLADSKPGNQKIRRRIAGGAAAISMGAALIPSPSLPEDVTPRDAASQEVDLADAAAPTPGYERGRAEEAVAEQEANQELPPLEPVSGGREVLPDQSIPEGSELVTKPEDGAPNPAFDFAEASSLQQSRAEGPNVAGSGLIEQVQRSVGQSSISQEVNHGDPLDGGLPGSTETDS